VDDAEGVVVRPAVSWWTDPETVSANAAGRLTPSQQKVFDSRVWRFINNQELTEPDPSRLEY